MNWENLKNLPTILAIKWVRYQLRKDEGLYRAYHSNIAMAFKDEAFKYPHFIDLVQLTTLHEYCNAGATRFMDMWIKEAK